MPQNVCLRLIDELKKLPVDVLRNTHFEIKKNLKLFPPAKNSNKFPYGLINEKIVINLVKNVGVTQHLDNNHISGSEYRNDLSVFNENFSVKAIANIGTKIILVNKLTISEHIVNDLNLINVFCRHGIICVIPIADIDDSYIQNKDSTVCLKGSFYNKYVKNSAYELKLPELTAEQLASIDSIEEVDYSDYLYEMFVKTNLNKTNQ